MFFFGGLDGGIMEVGVLERETTDGSWKGKLEVSTVVKHHCLGMEPGGRHLEINVADVATQ